MICQGCGQDNANVRDDLLLCKSCFNPSSGKLVSQTEAKRSYALSQKDINTLNYATSYNSHSGNFDTKLFLKSDLNSCAVAKYGSQEKLKEQLENRHKRRTEIQNRKEMAQQDRRRKLQKYLVSIGLPGIREDSTICSDYIEEGEDSGWTIESIGDVMKEMDFFYSKTNYPSVLRETRREYGGGWQPRYEYGVRREWYQWTEDDEEEVRQEAKHRSLSEYIKKNHQNPHKISNEVPDSLKPIVDQMMEKYLKKIKPPVQQKVPKIEIDLLDKINKTLMEIEQKEREIEKELLETPFLDKNKKFRNRES